MPVPVPVPVPGEGVGLKGFGMLGFGPGLGFEPPGQLLWQAETMEKKRRLMSRKRAREEQGLEAIDDDGGELKALARELSYT